jgi:hypothetical protein
MLRDKLYGHAAGNFSGVVSSHAIRYHQQQPWTHGVEKLRRRGTELAARCQVYQKKTVLVVRPLTSGVALAPGC